MQKLQIVVAQPKAQPQKRKKKKKRAKRRKNQIGISPNCNATRQFYYALKWPFAPDALGVRVPDSICYPTTTAHLRQTYVCTSDAAGVWSGAFLPLPTASCIMNVGSISMTSYTANTNIGYVTTPANLAQTFRTYRVVSWGVRIIITDTNMNAKGVYRVAPVLMPIAVPSYGIINLFTASNVTQICACFGIPVPDVNLPNLPAVAVFNAQDMMATGDFLLRGVPVLPTAYDMKTVYDTPLWSAGKYIASTSLVTDAATPTFSGAGAFGNYELHITKGQIGYVMYVSGLPATTASFAVEIVYHLEGVPQSTNVAVPTSTPSPAGSTAIIERVAAALHTAGEYFAMGQKVWKGATYGASTLATAYTRYRRPQAIMVD